MLRLRHIGLALAIAIAADGITSILPVQSRPQPARAADTGKCYDNCTDPNRPSYDTWGNQWTYDGKLIHAACPNVPDPISHQDNPECVCPAPTSQGAYHLQGYDKETNKAVCRLEYYQACPYADAQPADGPVCAKLRAQQQSQPTNRNQCGGK